MLGALIAKSRVRKGFATIKKGELDAFLTVFSDDAVVIYPSKGTMNGKAAIREFYRHFLRTFPKIEVDVSDVCVENLFDLIGTNSISTHFKILTTNRKGIAFEQEGMQLIRTRRGKLTLLHYFFFDTDALRHAWRESEENHSQTA
jgi:uncharacterized protein (TIGR02246 family)